MNNEPVSRRTRSKAPIKSTSERGIRAQLRSGAAVRIGRSPNDAGGPAKRRKKDARSPKSQKKATDSKVLNRSSVTNLQDMPDDMLTKIVDFLGSSDGNYLYSGKRITENDLHFGYSRDHITDEDLNYNDTGWDGNKKTTWQKQIEEWA